MINILKGENLLNIEYLKDKYKNKDLEIIDYTLESIAFINKKYLSISLFQEEKIIIVINPTFLINKTNKLKKKEEIYFEELINKENINKIYFLIEKELNKKIEYVKNNFKDFNILEINQKEVLENFISEKEIKISQSNLTYLEKIISEEYSIEHELIKLSMYNNKKEITKDLINENIVTKPQITIFDFISKILINDKKAAYKLYIEVIKKLEYSQEQIIAIIHSQIKFLLQVYVLKNKKIKIDKIMKILGSNSYRIKKNFEILEMTNKENLKKIYRLVADYDYAIKSGKTKEDDIILNFLI